MLLDNLFENIPHLRLQTLYHLLRVFDIVRRAVCHQLLHDERLEQLDRHLLRQTALINLQLRSYYDNGTSRIVDTFSEQVLTETSGFTLQHIGKRFKRTVARSGNRASAASVVDEGVHRLLQHSLFVSYNDIRSAELQQSFQTVVAVDDAAVLVI